LFTACALIPKYSATCSVLNTPPFCSIRLASGVEAINKRLAKGSEALHPLQKLGTSHRPEHGVENCQARVASVQTNDSMLTSPSICRMRVSGLFGPFNV